MVEFHALSSVHSAYIDSAAEGMVSPLFGQRFIEIFDRVLYRQFSIDSFFPKTLQEIFHQ